MANFVSVLGDGFDRSVTRQLEQSGEFCVDFDAAEQNPELLHMNAYSDVANEISSSHSIQSNQHLRLEMQANIGHRSRAVQPSAVQRLVGSNGVTHITDPGQLRVAMRLANQKKVSPRTPTSAFASLPVVSTSGMTNANNRISRNGLNPTARRATQMTVEEEMARRLDYRSHGIGLNDAIDVNDKRPPPPPLPPGNQQPLSPSPGSKRIKTIKERVIIKSSSLEDDDDELPFYEDIIDSFNDPSHPHHVAKVGFTRDTVPLNDDDAMRAVVRYNKRKKKEENKSK
jgi:hypothetical protein